MAFIIKRFQTSNFKITVEDLQNERETNPFIATFWDKEDCLEADRTVVEFETYGGALDQAFDWLANAYSKKLHLLRTRPMMQSPKQKGGSHEAH